MYFHEVLVSFTTGNLADCLEPCDPAVVGPAPANDNNLILDLVPKVLYQYRDGVEREEIRAGNSNHPIKEFHYSQHETTTGQRTYIGLNENGTASAAYLWITDLNGKEIPRQLVSNITVKLNGQISHDLSGLHCRHVNREHLPHPTIENNSSRNLYYISFSGKIYDDGWEGGLNLSRVDNYSWQITWANGEQQDVSLNFVHRVNNILRVRHGMAGVYYANDAFPRFVAYIPARQEDIHARQEDFFFENTEQLIDIPADETCMLTQDFFTEGYK